MFDLLALIITQLTDPEPDSEILEQTFRLWKNLLLSGIKDHVCGSVTQILSLVLISGWMNWMELATVSGNALLNSLKDLVEL